MIRRLLRFLLPALALAALPLGGVAFAQPPLSIEFDTELLSLNLGGGPFLLPLASDPGNLLGDSISGYGLVLSQISITLSSQRLITPGPPSLGQACAYENRGAGEAKPMVLTGSGNYCGNEPFDPDTLCGDQFYVDSFFDVFYDITVTDVDARPGRDYAGQADGASIGLQDNGPAHMASFYGHLFECGEPNYGLVPPPEADPYIGHFNVEIPLGVDINGNGENDKIKFTLATHSAGDENRTFIILPDGTVIDNFDSAAYLEGLVVDMSTDPPFTIGSLDPDTGLPDPASFGGPTTASSKITNPDPPVPVEDSTWGKIKQGRRD